MQNHKTNESQPQNIIFFDGECLLCNGFVLFVLNRDKKKKLFFAPLQGLTAQSYLNQEQLQHLETIYFYSNNQIQKQSDAIIGILTLLGGLYRFFYLFKIIPGTLRDLIYQIIAKSRYRIFGRQDYCAIQHPNKSQILN